MAQEPILLNTQSLRLTEDAFFNFCQDNKGIRLEREPNGNIILMEPTGFYSGKRNTSINGQLYVWNEEFKLGVVADSSTGFLLPNNAVREPDASWISHERLSKVPIEKQEKFLPACPEFIIELKSKTDSIDTLKRKMVEWMENGALLAFLIHPEKETVYLYHSSTKIMVHQGFDSFISGEPVLKGFKLDLRKLI